MKIKKPNPIIKFDEDFHSDHAKLNKELKAAGIPIRYPKIKKR